MKSIRNEIKDAILKSISENSNNIVECIESYLSRNVDVDADFLAQEIIEDLDMDSVCDDVEKILVDRSLTFMVYPEISNSEDGHRITSEYMCPACYRPHGQWVGINGVPTDPNILQNGKSIIVVE